MTVQEAAGLIRESFPELVAGGFTDTGKKPGNRSLGGNLRKVSRKDGVGLENLLVGLKKVSGNVAENKLPDQGEVGIMDLVTGTGVREWKITAGIEKMVGADEIQGEHGSSIRR